MKLIRSSALLILVLLLVPGGVYAQRRGTSDYFLRPQMGLWFGPVTPMGTTGEVVDTSLGGGLFFRYNTPFKPLKLGLDGSYQQFDSKGVNELILWPVYGSFLFRIPLRFAIIFQLKAGAGASYVQVEPDGFHQWDPTGMLGFEGSFPAGKYVNIGLRIDYLYIYEGYIEGAKRDGHVLNTGVTLYFNVGK